MHRIKPPDMSAGVKPDRINKSRPMLKNRLDRYYKWSAARCRGQWLLWISAQEMLQRTRT